MTTGGLSAAITPKEATPRANTNTLITSKNFILFIFNSPLFILKILKQITLKT
jgi:hypothetical protein